jgi:predicted NBD/HSP70 family sugar kinase
MEKKKRPGRGRLSTIDLLPADIRVQVNADLRGRTKTQKQILDEINPELAKRGHDPVSKSAFNRYSIQVEEKGSMMREAREAADALVGGLGEHKGTDLGRAVTEMVKTLSFDLVLNGGELDVDTLNKVALIAQRIERASKISLEREEQLRRQVLEQAAETVEESAIQTGLTEEQAQLWREKILGIK